MLAVKPRELREVAKAFRLAYGAKLRWLEATQT